MWGVGLPERGRETAFLVAEVRLLRRQPPPHLESLFSLILSSLELSDTTIYEP